MLSVCVLGDAIETVLEIRVERAPFVECLGHGAEMRQPALQVLITLVDARGTLKAGQV